MAQEVNKLLKSLREIPKLTRVTSPVSMITKAVMTVGEDSDSIELWSRHSGSSRGVDFVSCDVDWGDPFRDAGTLGCLCSCSHHPYSCKLPR